jgi:hypothetical protein
MAQLLSRLKKLEAWPPAVPPEPEPVWPPADWPPPGFLEEVWPILRAHAYMDDEAIARLLLGEHGDAQEGHTGQADD